MPQITGKPELTTPANDDLLWIHDTSAGAMKKIQRSNLLTVVTPGFIGAAGGWTYSAANQITVTSGDAANMSVGTRVSLVQSSTTKYFYVIAKTGTTITLTGGSDYTLANAAITSPQYSNEATPPGFPLWMNYTPSSVTGFSTNPTATYRFHITGRICTVTTRRSADGTSNATGFTVSAPVAAANPVTYQWTAPCTGTNNGVALTAPGLVQILNNSSTINVYGNYAAGGWTASGAKGADFTLSYEM